MGRGLGGPPHYLWETRVSWTGREGVKNQQPPHPPPPETSPISLPAAQPSPARLAEGTETDLTHSSSGATETSPSTAASRQLTAVARDRMPGLGVRDSTRAVNVCPRPSGPQRGPRDPRSPRRDIRARLSRQPASGVQSRRGRCAANSAKACQAVSRGEACTQSAAWTPKLPPSSPPLVKYLSHRSAHRDLESRS